MKSGRFLTTVLTLVLLLAAVSCRDNEITNPQPKPKKQSGARTIGNSAYSDWQNNLSWTQQNFIDQQADPEDFAYSLWSDEQSASYDLTARGYQIQVTPEYPFHCYQIALLGAYHTSSIGATKAQEWIKMTYIDGIGYFTETVYNFNVGKNVALVGASNLDSRVFNEMFVNGKNFKIPGTTNNYQQIGTFNGVPVYKNLLIDLFADSWAAATYPSTSRSNSEIHLGSAAADAAVSNAQRVQLLQHEFGHILQKEYIANRTGSEVSAITCFYSKIAIKSVNSTLRQESEANYYHKCFWTEVTANHLSKNFFYPNNIPGWNEAEYPSYNNSQCSGYEVRSLDDMCN